MAIRGPLCAIQAGCCAALASVSAKIATSFDAATAISLSLMEIIHTICGLDLVPYAEKSTVCIRLLGVAGIFVFNALMWVLFTKSMHLCSSTLEATAFNTSANFISTAIVGKLLFGEQLSMQWCLGSTLIVLGLVVLHKGSSQTADDLSVPGDSHIQGKTDSIAKLKKT
ncbi:transmembrane protein 42 [Plakobranchus ocellatus]|uniref:Transmembrane protein 42 n=1 Tax=Plakobranchus ocellatus TaxID=259542 RepID=A0AAV4CGC8_9GAST|nr:transmembrane protein 42 [Plakobranchus ocellatus]